MPSSRRPAYWLYHSLWSLLDGVFPPYCGGCSQRGALWCAACHSTTPRIEEPVCPICGEPLPASRICDRCSTSRPAFTAARSWGEFRGPLRKALHRLKYKRDMAMGDSLAVMLIDLLSTLAWPVNLVVPVPLGVARLKERGYNQSNLLALPVALGLGIGFNPRVIIRQRETRSQVDLTIAERKVNVAGAFQAKANLVKGRNVLIIDDVMTTGATLDACAAAALAAGANQVYGLTMARSVKKRTLHPYKSQEEEYGIRS